MPRSIHNYCSCWSVCKKWALVRKKNKTRFCSFAPILVYLARCSLKGLHLNANIVLNGGIVLVHGRDFSFTAIWRTFLTLAWTPTAMWLEASFQMFGFQSSAFSTRHRVFPVRGLADTGLEDLRMLCCSVLPISSPFPNIFNSKVYHYKGVTLQQKYMILTHARLVEQALAKDGFIEIHPAAFAEILLHPYSSCNFVCFKKLQSSMCFNVFCTSTSHYSIQWGKEWSKRLDVPQLDSCKGTSNYDHPDFIFKNLCTEIILDSFN